MDIEIKSGYHYKNEIKQLFTEYTNLLIENDKSFKDYLNIQNYDKEINDLESKYGYPEGRLYIVFFNNLPIGCIALRKIDNENAEIKRLYVTPKYRKNKIGKLLVEKIMFEAKEIGYKHILLDTLPFLTTAIKMYKKYGFKEIEKYNNSPIENTIYLKYDL